MAFFQAELAALRLKLQQTEARERAAQQQLLDLQVCLKGVCRVPRVSDTDHQTAIVVW